MADRPAPAEAPTSVRGPARADVVLLLVVGALLGILVAAVLATLSTDPGGAGVVARYGPVAARVAAEIGAVLTVGALLFAVFLVPPQRSGTVDVAGYAALRAAGWAALLWGVGAALSVPFTAATAIGKPVSAVLAPRTLTDLIGLLPEAQAWLLTAAVALMVAVACRFALSWGSVATLFGVAVFGLLPVGLSGGHSGTGGNHDWAASSLILHLVAVALWVGGLAALLAHGRRQPDYLGLAATRFSRLALVCWIVMAASGVINALVRLPLAEVFTTPYGLLVLAKISALVLLGGFGYLQRQRGVRAVVATGSGRALLRLAGIEVLVMFGTIGVAVALAATPPPESGAVEPSSTELALGYALDGPPTLGRLLLDWRFDLIYGTTALAAAVVYLMGVRRLRARGESWPVGRTLVWLGGCATVLLATSSGFGRYAPAVFSVHLQAHVMLAMLAPLLLVLGAPAALALRALRPAGADDPPGPREWLVALADSPAVRALTHPVVAVVLFTGSFTVLYLSGLYDSLQELRWAHGAMNGYFLLTGLLFYATVIGVDPIPRRPPPLTRIGMALAALPFHIVFGMVLITMSTVIGEAYYAGLGLPWLPDRLADQRVGGGFAAVVGAVPLLVVLVVLLMRWARSDDRRTGSASPALTGNK